MKFYRSKNQMNLLTLEKGWEFLPKQTAQLAAEEEGGQQRKKRVCESTRSLFHLVWQWYHSSW